MATTDHKMPGSALRAQIDERFFAPFKRNTFATRTWFFASVAAVVALHVTLLGYFLYRDKRQPDQIAQQETPVEVVVEAPRPPPPQKQAQKQQQEIEKPATSAPRAENQSKIDTEKLDDATHAQKAAAPPQDGQPQPAQEAADETKDTVDKDDKKDAAPPADVLKKDEEALAKAAPVPDAKAELAKEQKAKIAAKLKRDKAATARQLAGLSDTPDYKFARQTKASPVSGGTEEARYLAIVYGLILRTLQPAGQGRVTVGFNLDDRGNIIDIGLIHPSGDFLSDEEIVNAVRRASPFPPPPPDKPHGLQATINFASVGRPLAMGVP